MELIIGAAVIFGVILLIAKIFGGKKSKNEPDKYMVVQQRQARVTNHVVKVPGGKKKR